MIAMNHNEEVAYRLSQLRTFLERFEPTKLPLEPTPDQILDLKEDLERLAHFVDPVITAYAELAIATTGHHIPERLYVGQLSGAIDGNLLHEIYNAAESLAEDMAAAV